MKRLLRALLLLLGATVSLIAALLASVRPDVLFLLLGLLTSSTDRLVALLALAGAALAGLALWIRPLLRWRRVGGLGVAALSGGALAVLAVHRYGAYGNRDVRITTGGVQLAGTLYLPRDGGPHPGVVITPGSGAIAREFYRFYADRIARAGFTVLVYDKRGVGGSGGHYEGENNSSAANLDTLALDLAAVADWLASQPEAIGGRVGVWGISQAGWVAPIAAARTGKIAWLAMVSGPAVPTREENVYSDLAGEGGDHLGTRPPPMPPREIDRVLDTLSRRGFDPEPYLERLSQPSLWVYGQWDRSVPAERSARRLGALALSHRGPTFTVRVYPEAGHLLLISGNRGHGPLPTFARGFWSETLAWMQEMSGAR